MAETLEQLDISIALQSILKSVPKSHFSIAAKEYLLSNTCVFYLFDMSSGSDLKDSL